MTGSSKLTEFCAVYRKDAVVGIAEALSLKKAKSQGWQPVRRDYSA